MGLRKPKLFYLQNNTAGYCGNSPMFWREDGSGYTPWLSEAKKFTREEADAIINSTRGSHSWTKHAVTTVDRLAKLTIDIQDLRKHYDDAANFTLNKVKP